MMSRFLQWRFSPRTVQGIVAVLTSGPMARFVSSRRASPKPATKAWPPSLCASVNPPPRDQSRLLPSRRKAARTVMRPPRGQALAITASEAMRDRSIALTDDAYQARPRRGCTPRSLSMRPIARYDAPSRSSRMASARAPCSAGHRTSWVPSRRYPIGVRSVHLPAGSFMGQSRRSPLADRLALPLGDDSQHVHNEPSRRAR